jgi:hypothetical protein
VSPARRAPRIDGHAGDPTRRQLLLERLAGDGSLQADGASLQSS